MDVQRQMFLLLQRPTCELSHKIISIDPLTGVSAIKTKVIFDMLVSVLQF
jgi:hypothetical protein